MKIYPIKTKTVNNQINFKKNAVSNILTNKSSKFLRNSLIALSMLGSSMLVSCSHDNELDINKSDLNIELIKNGSVNEKGMQETENINDKTNFLFHKLGIIVEDKRISDIKNLSFTDENNDRYELNKVGECENSTVLSGNVCSADNVKKHAKLEFGTKTFNGKKCLYVNSWHNKDYNYSLIYQAGWEKIDGKLQPVFVLIKHSSDGDSGEKYSNENAFVIRNSENSITFEPVNNKNKNLQIGTLNINGVEYKTGEEDDESDTGSKPAGYTFTVTHNYK